MFGQNRRTRHLGLIVAACIACAGVATLRTFVTPIVPRKPAIIHKYPPQTPADIVPLASHHAGATSSGTLAVWAGFAASMIAAAAASSGSGKKQALNRKVALKASVLEQLGTMTTVVADTGVLEDIKKYKPQDATTNPSLVLKALSGPDAGTYFGRAIEWAANSGKTINETPADELVEDICERLGVLLGCDILEVVPGLVSTEVDARFSFDTEKMIEKGRKISGLYEEMGYGKDRVLIKLGSTWEAIPACDTLEKEGIHCNMTLIFSIAQAVACAEAGATLISPFVGRILDWYKNAENRYFAPSEDPGVLSVKEIYKYYKNLGHETTVMGASFRSPYEVIELAGCDKMTISPGILAQLEDMTIDLQRKLSPKEVEDSGVSQLEAGGLTEKKFRWLMNENAMATELLAQGLRNFAADGVKLEEMVRACLNTM